MCSADIPLSMLWLRRIYYIVVCGINANTIIDIALVSMQHSDKDKRDNELLHYIELENSFHPMIVVFHIHIAKWFIFLLFSIRRLSYFEI